MIIMFSKIHDHVFSFKIHGKKQCFSNQSTNTQFSYDSGMVLKIPFEI